MKCLTCGNRVTLHMKNCEGCGEPIGKTEVAATIDSASPEDAKASSGTSTSDFVEMGKKFTRTYGQFFMENLKFPSSKAGRADHQDVKYGALNVLLLSLFVGLGIYFQLKHFHVGFSMFGMDVSFKTFFSMFLYMILVSFGSTAVLFGILKVLMHVDVRFSTLFARFGSFLTIPAAISALYLVASLSGLSGVASFLGLFLITGLQIVSFATLYSFRQQIQTRFDPFYGLILYYLVFYFALFLIQDRLPGAFVGMLL
ncbi:MAG TPA: hypothetical protein VFK44_06585 [Bacillales bacterium]|nr:hypothetical protein [Bacillales bacterium]